MFREPARAGDTPESPGGRVPLLRVQALVKRFGGFRALDAVSFDVVPGEILGLVGPNGSGKTTCINVISGLYRPDGGAVMFDGRAIGGLPPHRLVRLGINRTFRVPKPFASLRVRENVEIAAAYGGGHGHARPLDVDRLLADLELDREAKRPALELNSVQQKMLDLARALATRPRLLCIDELAAGLNPAELARVALRLRDLAGSGITLLVVEHLMGFLSQVTDRVVVLNAGREIFEGALAAALESPQVIEVYLGAEDGGSAA
jgi:branched-chain amino acid transport system ATP-binding protein